MAEEQEINVQQEGNRIVNKYLSELGWAREYKREVARQLLPAIELEPKLADGDVMEQDAEGNFARECDEWRIKVEEGSKDALDVLEIVYKRLKDRRDLGIIGKNMIHRLKDEYF